MGYYHYSRKTFHPMYYFVFFFFFLFIHFLHITESKSNNGGGFSVKLIRKRSPISYPSRRLMESKSNTVQSPTNAYLGHYLMELSIGTPPRTIYGIADTGSDLIWTQCVPCDDCYKQINPMFDPKNSSTYKDISCESDACHKLDTRTCSSQNQNQLCSYAYAYASASMTQGTLAYETITFKSKTGDSVSLDGIIFGCGYNDTGTFNDHEMGIIGLGGGEVSLISQIGSSFGSKRFSQCLVPFHTDISISSRMSFGDGSEVSGDGVVSTPLVAKDEKTYYFVTLLGISVGNTYFPFNIPSGNNITKCNMFIDSGTPPTILPQQLYDSVVAEVRNQVRMGPIEDDPDLESQLCYKTEHMLEGPVITAHFEGADVELNPIQTFIPPKDGVLCLGLTNTSSDGGIYGNFAQSNYLIGFDLDKQLVSFKPMDCTKQ